MRSLVFVLLVALLAPARSAALPKAELEKKLDNIKDDLPKVPEKPIDKENTTKDIDNQLKKDPIPVEVIVEPSEETVKRVEVDLKHPGEPQRQEHETQNPEHYEDESSALVALKQMVKDTQEVFNKGYHDVSERIIEWVHDNKPEVTIKESIKNLQDSFEENIEKLNSTLQTYWNQGAEAEKQEEIKKVQSGLKVLEEKFETGVQSLNNGVQTLVVLKEGRDDATTTTARPPGIPGFGFVTNFWNTMTQSFGNVTNQFQNIIGQGNNSSTAAAGAQSDETSASTSKPTVWQGIQNQIQGIFQGRPQGAQSDEQPAQSGPFAQVIQNVPLLQNFVNFIQPKPTEPSKKPAQATSSEGSNVVPAEPEKPSDQQQKKPDDAAAAQPAPQSAAQVTSQGPIQQIIQKNPIVQGIAGAVQKIQHSITNPEKPRDVPVEQKGSEKGGFYPFYGGHGHGGSKPSSGDNNNVSSSGVKSAPIEAEKLAVEAEKPAVEAAASPEVVPASPEAVPAPEAIKKD